MRCPLQVPLYVSFGLQNHSWSSPEPSVGRQGVDGEPPSERSQDCSSESPSPNSSLGTSCSSKTGSAAEPSPQHASLQSPPHLEQLAASAFLMEGYDHDELSDGQDEPTVLEDKWDEALGDTDMDYELLSLDSGSELDDLDQASAQEGIACLLSTDIYGSNLLIACETAFSEAQYL